MLSLRDMTDDAFGNWLAGFAAGEGSFRLADAGAGLRAEFQLKLRDDAAEVETLLAIVERTGLGELYFTARTKKLNGHVCWKVQTKPECIALANLFESYPLRARKSADCLLWTAAVRHWALHRARDSWAPMRAYADQLDAAREYDPVSSEVRARIVAERKARRCWQRLTLAV